MTPIVHFDAEGHPWTLNLTACVPVFLYEPGPADPETGEPSASPLAGVRLDVAQGAMHASLEPFVVAPEPELHHFGEGKVSLYAEAWADLFHPESPCWRPLEADDNA